MTKRPENIERMLIRYAESIDTYEAESISKTWTQRVWLGTSVENQQTADERIPHLLGVPAAVRFLSCEPLLGPVDLTPWLASWFYECNKCGAAGESAERPGNPCGAEPAEGFENEGECQGKLTVTHGDADIGWVIVGGESGPNARPCRVEWVRSIVKQCKAAGVSVFVKQLGSNVLASNPCDPIDQFPNDAIPLRDKKGGDINEWPSDLRVREFPAEVQS